MNNKGEFIAEAELREELKRDDIRAKEFYIQNHFHSFRREAFYGDSILFCCLSLSGKNLVCVDERSQLIIYNLITKTEEFLDFAHFETISSITAANKTEKFIATTKEGFLFIYNITKQALESTYRFKNPEGSNFKVSFDDQFIVFINNDKKSFVYVHLDTQEEYKISIDGDGIVGLFKDKNQTILSTEKNNTTIIITADLEAHQILSRDETCFKISLLIPLKSPDILALVEATDRLHFIQDLHSLLLLQGQLDFSKIIYKFFPPNKLKTIFTSSDCKFIVISLEDYIVIKDLQKNINTILHYKSQYILQSPRSPHLFLFFSGSICYLSCYNLSNKIIRNHYPLTISCVSLSDDSKFIYLGLVDSSIQVIHLMSQKLKNILYGHKTPTSRLCGTYSKLASFNLSDSLLVWDLETSTITHKLQVTSIKFFLFAGIQSNCLIILENYLVSVFNLKSKYKYLKAFNHTITKIVAAMDRYICVVLDSGYIDVFDVENNEVYASIQGCDVAAKENELIVFRVSIDDIMCVDVILCNFNGKERVIAERVFRKDLRVYIEEEGFMLVNCYLIQKYDQQSEGFVNAFNLNKKELFNKIKQLYNETMTYSHKLEIISIKMNGSIVVSSPDSVYLLKLKNYTISRIGCFNYIILAETICNSDAIVTVNRDGVMEIWSVKTRNLLESEFLICDLKYLPIVQNNKYLITSNGNFLQVTRLPKSIN